MPLIRVLGKINPPERLVNLGVLAGIFEHHDLGLTCSWRVSIQDSNINFITEVSKVDISILGATINHAREVMGTITNLLSLGDGIPYSSNFDRIVMPDGTTSSIMVRREDAFAELITATAEMPDFQKILDVALFSDTGLAAALRDITDCLRSNHIGVIGLARAMDGICNFFVPEGGERKDGWPLMHKALNTTRAYVNSISDISKGPRHADWTGMDEPGLRKTVERAWKLMNRYLEYRKRGGQALSGPEFPLLDLPQA